uniref:LamG-like jellyroll fold domain-containing protein n=1 Tax=viral metagenome TaxID=1070528 RepID=A0A6C0B811_9ZZZZ
MDEDTPFQKFIIIMSALIVFTICMTIGINLLGYLVGPSTNPYLVKGLIPGNVPLVIQQDPSISGSIPIERANNQIYGLEFSWSVWLNISDLGKSGEYQHIFHKGDNNIQTEGDNIGMNFPNNAPGLYLSPTTNELIVVMNTFTTINEEIKIPNIPLNKWLHVVIRIENNNLDVYINGTLAKRHVLGNVPKQNYGNVNIALNGGFQGYISDLRYFSHALQPGEIVSIVNDGPTLIVNKQSNIVSSTPPYLSLQWYVQDSK